MAYTVSTDLGLGLQTANTITVKSQKLIDTFSGSYSTNVPGKQTASMFNLLSPTDQQQKVSLARTKIPNIYATDDGAAISPENQLATKSAQKLFVESKMNAKVTITNTGVSDQIKLAPIKFAMTMTLPESADIADADIVSAFQSFVGLLYDRTISSTAPIDTALLINKMRRGQLLMPGVN